MDTETQLDLQALNTFNRAYLTHTETVWSVSVGGSYLGRGLPVQTFEVGGYSLPLAEAAAKGEYFALCVNAGLSTDPRHLELEIVEVP